MTALKSILVHLRAQQDWAPAIDLAIGLAQRFEAGLTGLYTMRELAMTKLVLGHDHRAVRDAEARDTPPMEKMRSRFLDAAANANVTATFEVGEGNASELLAFAGRCHDLVVLEQAGGGLDGLGRDAAEECTVTSGVPKLLVPASGDFANVGRSVAIAWNHSRQAAAALRGALPLIAKADRVVVLIGDERDHLPSVTKRPHADISEYLRHHVESVEIRLMKQAGLTGRDLQPAARNAGADVLVMGAYGRSAWREFVFGGTTREVVENLEMPVLMAH